MTEMMQKAAPGVDKDDAEVGPEKAEVKADVEAKARLCLLTYLLYFTYFKLLYKRCSYVYYLGNPRR